MLGACVGEEELEGKRKVKKQRRRFSALPQKRLNIRSEAEAVEILGLIGEDYKFICKEGTKDQVSFFKGIFFFRILKLKTFSWLKCCPTQSMSKWIYGIENNLITISRPGLKKKQILTKLTNTYGNVTSKRQLQRISRAQTSTVQPILLIS